MFNVLRADGNKVTRRVLASPVDEEISLETLEVAFREAFQEQLDLLEDVRISVGHGSL